MNTVKDERTLPGRGNERESLITLNDEMACAG